MLYLRVLHTSSSVSIPFSQSTPNLKEEIKPRAAGFHVSSHGCRLESLIHSVWAAGEDRDAVLQWEIREQKAALT